MNEYWFCGIFPKDVISEEILTNEQKIIVTEAIITENKDNYMNNWLGYKTENGWRFMKHGQEVVYINEEKSNIARILLYEKIKLKYEI